MILRIWAPVALLAALSVGALTWPKHRGDYSVETLTEIQKLSAALELYRDRYGEYPPDFADENLVVEHVHRIMPDYRGPMPMGMTAPQALVFWLSGFSDEPGEPFGIKGNREPLFDFDRERVVVQDNGEVYLPPGARPFEQPYYYHDSRTYLAVASSGAIAARSVPYVAQMGGDGAPARWVNGDSFQVIAAGHDGHFGQPGSYKTFPDATGWTEYDGDNLANFYDRPIGAAKSLDSSH